jgi:predicted RNase H-like nuclease
MSKKSTVEIIGVDPAPGKNSFIYDGDSFYDLNADELIDFFKEKEKSNNILICWDAPLSGPDIINKTTFSGSYTDRPVEKALRKAIGKVEGCSVLPYSGCPHWTVSKAVFGYPIVGKFDTLEKDLPFKKLRSKEDSGKLIVEVHPAVSMYFWLGNDFKKYKGSGITKAKQEMAIKNNLKGVKKAIGSSLKLPEINSDDELDAFVAYVMGYFWIHQNPEVSLLGNEDKGGAMLLPNKAEIIEKVDDKLNKLLTP